MSSLLWIWDSEIRQLPYDTAQAGRILNARGWRDHDGDGVRDKNGQPLTFRILVPTTSALRSGSEASSHSAMANGSRLTRRNNSVHDRPPPTSSTNGPNLWTRAVPSGMSEEFYKKRSSRPEGRRRLAAGIVESW